MIDTMSVRAKPTAPVLDAVQDLAEALMATPAYCAFEKAAEQARNAPAVNAAMRSLEARQVEIQRAQGRGGAKPADWRELEQLRNAVQNQPAVVTYAQAQLEFAELCHQIDHIISYELSLGFAANAQRSSH